MNTLKEIGEFVGLGNATPPRPGKPIRAQITMRSVKDSVPVLSNIEQTSMKSMIIALQNLPSISLEAENRNPNGEVPFPPEVDVNFSNGVIIDTSFTLFQNGQVLLNEFMQGNGPAKFSLFTLGDPGSYVLEVKRTGIPNTGITTLKKTFNIEARAKLKPPVPISPPIISVKSNGDGSFVVNGSGFLKSTKVTIRVADAQLNNLFFAQTSTPDGKLVDMPTGKICQVPGGQITFSGQDGSIDPSNHQAIFSNFVTMTCPFA